MLAWTPSHPGKSLLYMILPLLALGTAWGAYASVALLQRMLSMSRGMEQSEREAVRLASVDTLRSEEHTSELQSLMRISYDVFCLKKQKTHTENTPKYMTQ